MVDLDFYKSLYDKEITRRIEIDNLINTNVAVISIIVTSNYFLVKNFSNSFKLGIILYEFLFFTCILYTLLFLTQSFNKFFTGFDYHNLPNTIELRAYQLELKKNPKAEDFNDYLIETLVAITDNNLKINRYRLLYIFYSRIGIIFTMLLTLGNVIILVSQIV